MGASPPPSPPGGEYDDGVLGILEADVVSTARSKPLAAATREETTSEGCVSTAARSGVNVDRLDDDLILSAVEVMRADDFCFASAAGAVAGDADADLDVAGAGVVAPAAAAAAAATPPMPPLLPSFGGVAPLLSHRFTAGATAAPPPPSFRFFASALNLFDAIATVTAVSRIEATRRWYCGSGGGVGGGDGGGDGGAAGWGNENAAEHARRGGGAAGGAARRAGGRRRARTSSDVIAPRSYSSSGVAFVGCFLEVCSRSMCFGLVASHMSSMPLRKRWQSCSARHHARRRYDSKSQTAPVCRWWHVGATITNSAASEEYADRDWIASFSVASLRCGMEE